MAVLQDISMIGVLALGFNKGSQSLQSAWAFVAFYGRSDRNIKADLGDFNQCVLELRDACKGME